MDQDGFNLYVEDVGFKEALCDSPLFPHLLKICSKKVHYIEKYCNKQSAITIKFGSSCCL